MKKGNLFEMPHKIFKKKALRFAIKKPFLGFKDFTQLQI